MICWFRLLRCPRCSHKDFLFIRSNQQHEFAILLMNEILYILEYVLLVGKLDKSQSKITYFVRDGRFKMLKNRRAIASFLFWCHKINQRRFTSQDIHRITTCMIIFLTIFFFFLKEGEIRKDCNTLLPQNQRTVKSITGKQNELHLHHVLSQTKQ